MDITFNWEEHAKTIPTFDSKWDGLWEYAQKQTEDFYFRLRVEFENYLTTRIAKTIRYIPFESETVMGFVANSDTKVTTRNKGWSYETELKAGEFLFALEGIYPLSPMAEHVLLQGDVDIIYKWNVSDEKRRALFNTPQSLPMPDGRVYKYTPTNWEMTFPNMFPKEPTTEEVVPLESNNNFMNFEQEEITA